MEDLLSLRPMEELCPQHLAEDLLLQAVAGDLLFQVLVRDLLPQVPTLDFELQLLAVASLKFICSTATKLITCILSVAFDLNPARTD